LVRRQGNRDQSYPADPQGGALYGRTVGRQVPQDLHLSARAHRRGFGDDRRILQPALRARRLRRSRRAGQYPRPPLRPAQRPLCWEGRSARNPMILPVTPSFRLDGRRALVTGAGRGIGLACAAALAEAGAEVTLAARSTGEIEAATAAIV